MQTPMPPPTIGPLGEQAILIRFGTQLTEAANRRAIACARRLQAQPPRGVAEIAPNLVSVLVRYEIAETSYAQLAGELRLLLALPDPEAVAGGRRVAVAARFGGADGPDLEAVAGQLGLAPAAFVAAHNARPLRVLSSGFAPGFVYCGLHEAALAVPRRPEVRPTVPAGTLLFAAGQTAITATPVPTGWHVIGRTAFRNFDPAASPPMVLGAGDEVVFEAA